MDKLAQDEYMQDDLDIKTDRLDDTIKLIGTNAADYAKTNADVNTLDGKENKLYQEVVKNVNSLSSQMKGIDTRDQGLWQALKKENLHANEELVHLKDQEDTQQKHEADIKHMLKRERERLGVEYEMEKVADNAKHTDTVVKELQKTATEIRDPKTVIKQRSEILKLEQQLYSAPPTKGKVDPVKLPAPIPAEFQDFLPSQMKTDENVKPSEAAPLAIEKVQVPKEEWPQADRDNKRFAKKVVDQDFSAYDAPETASEGPPEPPKRPTIQAPVPKTPPPSLPVERPLSIAEAAAKAGSSSPGKS